jgi:hypothetical protein
MGFRGGEALVGPNGVRPVRGMRNDWTGGARLGKEVRPRRAPRAAELEAKEIVCGG